MTLMQCSSTKGTWRGPVTSAIEDGPTSVSYTDQGRTSREGRCKVLYTRTVTVRGTAAPVGSVTHGGGE